MVVAEKKYHAFKAERHRDENEVTILGACAVQVSLPCPSWMRRGTLKACASRD